MPSLGPAEILVILVIALLVFGPNKLPEIARQVGQGVRELRKVQSHLKDELHGVVGDLDPTTPSNPKPGPSVVPSLPPKADGGVQAGEATLGEGFVTPEASTPPSFGTPVPPATPTGRAPSALAVRRLDRPDGTGSDPSTGPSTPSATN